MKLIKICHCDYIKNKIENEIIWIDDRQDWSKNKKYSINLINYSKSKKEKKNNNNSLINTCLEK